MARTDANLRNTAAARTEVSSRTGGVYNSGFELFPRDVATTGNAWIGTASATYSGWWSIRLATAHSSEFDTSEKHSGDASLLLQTTDATGKMLASNCTSASLASLQEGAKIINSSTAYELSFWIKTNNVPTDAAFGQIVQYDSAAVVGTTTTSTKYSGTNDWFKVTMSFTSDADAYFLRINLYYNVAGNVGQIWFDDIHLIAVRSEIA